MLGQRTKGSSADERQRANRLERTSALIYEDECDQLFIDCCVFANLKQSNITAGASRLAGPFPLGKSRCFSLTKYEYDNDLGSTERTVGPKLRCQIQFL